MIKTLRFLLAVLTAAVLLCSCGAQDVTPVQGNAKRTEAAENKDSDNADEADGKTSKAEEAKAEMTTAQTTTEATTTEPKEQEVPEVPTDGESADDSYALSTFEKITFETPKTAVFVKGGISYFPDTAISYEDSKNDIRYILNGTNGSIILAIPYSEGAYDNAYWYGFEQNLVKLKIKSDYVYVDANGKNVTASLVTAAGTYTLLEDGYYDGVADADGNVVVEAIYDNISFHGDYFAFSLNNKSGVINTSGEMIIKGLSTYYTDLKFYPDNVLAGNALYSLPDGALVGEYQDIKPMSDNRFMVSSYDENGVYKAQIIDGKGKEVFDIIGDSPVSAEFCNYAQFNDFDNEKMWYHVRVSSTLGNSYYAFISATGKNLTGWRNAREHDANFYYFNETMILKNNTQETTTVYDYTGKKLHTFNALYDGINDKIFVTKRNNLFTFADIDGVIIGDFSDYYYRTARPGTIMVKDPDGMFYGMISGDRLLYQCEYTDYEYYNDYEYVILQKGNSEVMVTTQSGAPVTIPE
jgi:hypothetical protein